MRPSWRPAALFLIAVAVGTVLVGGGVPVITPPIDQPADPEPDLVTVGPEARQLWPYVAAERSFDRPASSINVVFHGDADRVHGLLTSREAWNESADPQPAVNPGASSSAVGAPVVWRDLASAHRYTYTESRDSARWLAPSYQLHRGDYLGSQHHLRVYELSEDRVAVQAHTEHWDWLLLTHVVDSLQAARLQVETDFMGRSAVEDVRREYYANGDTYDADGWATVIRLAFVLPIVGLATVRSVRNRFDTPRYRCLVGLAVTLPALLLGVRLLGIAAERSLPVSVDVVALLLYPFIAAGLPVAAYVLGRRAAPYEGFAVAAVALGLAVRVDYSILAIAVIPIEVVVHRATAAVAIGLIAAGAGGNGHQRNALIVGVGLWLAVLLVAVV